MASVIRNINVSENAFWNLATILRQCPMNESSRNGGLHYHTPSIEFLEGIGAVTLVLVSKGDAYSPSVYDLAVTTKANEEVLNELTAPTHQLKAHLMRDSVNMVKITMTDNANNGAGAWDTLWRYFAHHCTTAQRSVEEWNTYQQQCEAEMSAMRIEAMKSLR